MAAEETALVGGLLGIALQTGLSISGNPKEGEYFGSLLNTAFREVSRFQEAKHEGERAVQNEPSAISTPPQGTTADTARTQEARETAAGKKSIFSQAWVWVVAVAGIAVIAIFGWRLR